MTHQVLRQSGAIEHEARTSLNNHHHELKILFYIVQQYLRGQTNQQTWTRGRTVEMTVLALSALKCDDYAISRVTSVIPGV